MTGRSLWISERHMHVAIEKVVLSVFTANEAQNFMAFECCLRGVLIISFIS
jgi:hypothetical protein